MRKITLELIIVFFLWANVIASLITIRTFDARFTLGGILLAIVTILLVLEKKKSGLLLLIFILLIGTFNGISFNYALGITLGGLNLIPICLLFGLIRYRRLELLDLVDDWFSSNSEEMEEVALNKVGFFKREFGSLSSEELIGKLNNENLVAEARIAINQILRERDITMNQFLS